MCEACEHYQDRLNRIHKSLHRQPITSQAHDELMSAVAQPKPRPPGQTLHFDKAFSAALALPVG